MDTPLTFDTPNSSLVKGASYDPSTQTLNVTLAAGRYTYTGVPEATWVAFEQASSKGQFFNERIRPMFVARKQ